MGKVNKVRQTKSMARDAQLVAMRAKGRTADKRGPLRTWRVWCAAYAETGCQRRACEAAGVPYGQHRRWMKHHEKFRQMVAHAEQVAGDLLEAEAFRRAREGVMRPVLYRGVQVRVRQVNPETGKKELLPLYEVSYSDVMMMFLLRGFKPEKYGPKSVNDLGAGLPQYKEIEGAKMEEV